MHRTLHVVLRLLAVTSVALLAISVTDTASSAQKASNCSPSSSWGANRPDLAAQVVRLINAYRAGKGLQQFTLSPSLTASSEWKSLHMAANGYFDHDDPAPPIARTAYQRVVSCGYTGGVWGENIAAGYATAQSVVNGWLGSAGHRANIENARYETTGVGVAAKAGGRLYWTESFGNDATGAAAAGSKPKGAGTSAASTPFKTARGIGARPAYVTRSTNRSRLAASVPFVEMATGRPVTTGSVRCRAEVDGKRLRVVANVFRADAARCAWLVPTWARGEQITGVVAVQIGGTAARRLFIRKLA